MKDDLVKDDLVTGDPVIEVEMVVGTPRGGGQDRAARALADAMASVGRVSVAVSNLPGRGGGVAWSRVAESGGRDHVISIGSPTLVTNSIADSGEPEVGQFTHLAMLCTEEIAFVSATDRGPADAAGLLDVLGSRSAALTVAVATALGNVNHLAVVAVGKAAGADPRELRVEAYDAASLALEAVMSGEASVAAVSLASVLHPLETGAIRMLARSAPSGTSKTDLGPTWLDLGIDCDFVTWRSVLGPAGLNRETVRLWDHLLARAVRHPAWRTAMDEFRWTDRYLSSGEAEAVIRLEDLRLRRLAAELGGALG